MSPGADEPTRELLNQLESFLSERDTDRRGERRERRRHVAETGVFPADERNVCKTL